MKAWSQVRAFREFLGLSQEAFALQLGVTVRTVVRWEAGRGPRGHSLILLAHKAWKWGNENGASEERKCACGDFHYEFIRQFYREFGLWPEDVESL